MQKMSVTWIIHTLPGLIICLVYLHSFLTFGVTGQTREDLDACPKKPELVGDRRCMKSCVRQLDCRGRRKKCRCDDICGMSCINPNQKCEELSIVYGRVDIEPYNKFGAIANYTCNRGYRLHGLKTRTCVGDGTWTGEEPKCVVSAWLCRDPLVVENAIHDGNIRTNRYSIGTEIQYYCKSGYYRDGFYKAKCGDDGKWIGPRMSCIPRSCEHPGIVQNAVRVGDLFIFPHRVYYRCEAGFELIGHPYRECQADGRWSRFLPSCRPVRCRSLYPPENGHMLGNSIVFGAVAQFHCNPGYRIIGSDKRMCQKDKTWSGEYARCELIDCGMPILYNGRAKGSRTNLGAEIRFQCDSDTTFEGESMAECLETGQWSRDPPLCWLKCMPSSLANGRVTRSHLKTEHNRVLEYSCDEGYFKNATDQIYCHNGSWSQEPACVPAPCTERPPVIKNGYQRYQSYNNGDKVLYECTTGFQLINDNYLACRNGKWIGNVPECEPKYCPFPGLLRHGTILLVGVRGKYEYRSYVQRIRHGEQIEYHCHNGFRLRGINAATCINGQWSPKSKPRCDKGKHVDLPFRIKFIKG